MKDIPVGLTLLISGIADMNAILPFHFGAMICMFILMILTSITIIKFEKVEKLKQSNGIGLFFGIWYFIKSVFFRTCFCLVHMVQEKHP